MIPSPPIPDYELLRRIGGGSYGDVWLGRSVTGVYRAIKIVDRNRFKDSRPFLREFEGIKRFQQQLGQRPSQLALLHVGRHEQAGLFYYVMELADDGITGAEINPDNYVPFTLKELRARGTPTPASECLRIGVELTEALAELHKAGLIHRDVKPSNIIFVNGVAKLADLGLVASSDGTITSLGTPGYSPAEGSGTVRADIFSLGRVLYELVAGLPPEEYPRLPGSLLERPDTPALLELNEVILKATAPHPDNRYVSAQAMVDELRLIQAGRSLHELNRAKRLLAFAWRAGAAVGIAATAGLLFFGIRSVLAARELARVHEQNERFAHYTSELNGAQVSLMRENPGSARTALRRLIPQGNQPDLRGLEWQILWNRSEGDQTKTYGSPGDLTVNALVVDPTHPQFATQGGVYPRETFVWDLKTGARRSIAKNTYGLGDFSNDGENLVVGTTQRNVRTIGLSDGKLAAPHAIRGFVLLGLGDGRTVLVADRDTDQNHFYLWDTVNRETIASWSSPPLDGVAPFTSAAVSSDHNLLAVGFSRWNGVSTEHEVYVVQFQTGIILHRISTYSDVHSLAFSPDSQELAIGLEGPPSHIVSLKNEKVLQVLLHGGVLATLEYSADGSQIAGGGWDQTIRIWNAKSRQLELELRGHEGSVQVVRWVDATHVFSASADGTCRTWALEHQPPLKSTLSDLWKRSMGDVVFSPDGAQIAAKLETGSIGIFTTATLDQVREFENAFQPLAYTEDGRSLFALSFTGHLSRCDLETGNVLDLGLSIKKGPRLTVIEVSPSGRKVVICDNSGHLLIWDLATQSSILDQDIGPKSILAAAWTTDESSIAFGREEGLLELRTTKGAITVLPHQNRDVRELAFSRSGPFLAMGMDDGRVIILDSKTYRVTAEFEADNSQAPCLLFPPGNKRLLTAGADGFIHAWTIPQFRPIMALQPDDEFHSHGKASFLRLKISRDGHTLAGFSKEGGLRLWRSVR